MSYDPTKYAGAGTDTLEAEDKMPLVKIAQQLSPELLKSKDQYIEGLSAGDIFLNSEGVKLDNPLEIIPTGIKTIYVEWRSEDEGGGIVAMHPLSICGRRDLGYRQGVKTKYDEWLGNNQLKKTTYLVGLSDIEGEQKEVMIAFTGTSLGTARKLQGMISRFKYSGKNEKIAPPIFAQVFKLGTEQADKGYFFWTIEGTRVLDFKEDEQALISASQCYEQAQLLLPVTKDPLQLEDSAVDTEDVF